VEDWAEAWRLCQDADQGGGFMDEPVEEEAIPSPSGHVSRPLALRYHFIEICGGSGKVSKFVAVCSAGLVECGGGEAL